ncbi:hypothetical protein PFDG_04757, partial [Plasmodium falciparum Dd2]
MVFIKDVRGFFCKRRKLDEKCKHCVIKIVDTTHHRAPLREKKLTVRKPTLFSLKTEGKAYVLAAK